MADVPEKYRDFNVFLEPLKSIKPEVIIQEIKNDVGAFVENSFQTETNRSLLIVENKAKLLFEPYLDRFIEKKFSPAFVKSGYNVLWIKGVVSKRISILVDSINTGLEIIELVNNLSQNKYEVEKIYCYVVNSEAFQALNANKVTSGIPIESAHTLQMHLGDPIDLVEKLKLYYTSLPDPMDLEHAYDVYFGKCELTPAKLKSVIENCCKVALNTNSKFIADDKMVLPSNIESMRFDIPNPKGISIESNEKIKEIIANVKFDHANMKLKTFLKNGGLQFSLIGCFPVASLHKKSINPNDGCKVCDKSSCYHSMIDCQRSFSKVLRWKVFCPLCVQNYVERSILNCVRKLIEIQTEGKAKFVIQPHDPIDRKI